MKDCLIQSGDIALGANRDIQTTDKIIEAVVRRAATIPTGYSKVVRERNQQRIVNPNYGTQLAAYLSTSVSGSSLVDELMRAADDDGRVEIYDIKYKDGYNTIDIDIAYRDASNDSIQRYSVGI